MRTVTFLTSNAHKVAEAIEALRGTSVEIRQVDLKMEEPQADKVEDIARACALRGAMRLKVPVVVEDSGLFISALNGFPGPYSSYVLGTIGIKGILLLMRGYRSRTARFESAVAYARSPKEAKVFKGIALGRISRAARGRSGFGFDPIFVADGCRDTFAEIGLREKGVLSHRGKAFRAFGRWMAKGGP